MAFEVIGRHHDRARSKDSCAAIAQAKNCAASPLQGEETQRVATVNLSVIRSHPSPVTVMSWCHALDRLAERSGLCTHVWSSHPIARAEATRR